VHVPVAIADNSATNFCAVSSLTFFLMSDTHRRRRRDSTVELSRVDRRCVGLLNSQLVHNGFGRRVENYKHVENLSSRVGSRIGNWVTTEYTPPDTTQLDSTCSVLNSLPNPSAARREL